jgi:3-hydroxypropanoate dehydrogenase
MQMLDDAALRLLFLDARTHHGWRAEPVSDETLRKVWELARMGPTSGNLSPARVVFVKSAEAKERLRPALAPGNVEKTMQAPVTAIVAYDTEFHEKSPLLSPRRDMRPMLQGLPAPVRDRVALVSGSLQGAYLILAARALGLDCGPMGGFDAAKVDEAFFKGTTWKANFLVNLGHGDEAKLNPRAPRLEFGDACRFE